MASLALGAVGAVAGFYLGGPVGASIGWSLGSMLGNALDPPKVVGPRLTDLHVQDSSYGIACPRAWGTVRIAGNVIWADGLHEHEHDSSGKGGGSSAGQPNDTFTYSASFAIRLCVGPIAGINRCWWNSRIVDLTTMPCKVYLGTASQLADPTIEAVEGAGNVPGYRNVAYVVFTELDLSAGGNAIGNWEFEVQTQQLLKAQRLNTLDPQPWTPLDGGAQNYPDNATIGYADGNILVGTFWGGQIGGPRLDGTDYIWGKGSSLTGFATGFHRKINEYDVDGTLVNTSTTYFSVGPYVEHVETGSRMACKNDLSWWFDAVNEGSYSRSDSHPTQHAWGQLWKDGNVIDAFGSFYDISAPFVVFDNVVFALRGPPSVTPGALSAISGILAEPLALYALDSDSTQYSVQVGTDGTLWVGNTNEGLLHLRFTGNSFELIESFPDFDATSIGGSSSGSGLIQFGYYCGKYVSYKSQVAYGDGWGHIDVALIGGAQPWPVVATIQYAHGASNAGVGPIYNLYNGNMGTGISNGQGLAWVQDGTLSICQISGVKIPVATILGDLSKDEAKLDAAEFDFSDVPDLTWGMVVANQMPVRNAIQLLRDAYFIDFVERDCKIYGIKRGHDSLVTIADDELAAHVSGSEAPAISETVRLQEPELPKSVTVSYFNHGADYQQGNQPAQRMTTQSQLAVAIPLPLVLDDDEAARIASVHLYGAWFERMQYGLKVTRKYSAYVPTDVIVARGRILRIISATHGADGVISFDCVGAAKQIYLQGATGGAAQGQTPVEPVAAQLTDLLMLDIPYIIDPSKQQVYYAAMAGKERRSWSGATLFKSIDNGVTWVAIASTSGPGDTFGKATTILGDFGGGNVFDEENAVTVELTAGSGELSSTTRLAIENGANGGMIGSEMVQWRDATLTDVQTYLLKGLQRGRNGTEWAMATHGVGEDFCALPVRTMLDAAWGDYGISRSYLAVTAGSSVDSSGGNPSGGPTPPGATPSLPCVGWDRTVLMEVTARNGVTPRLFSADYGGFGPDDILVIEVHTGNVAGSGSRITLAEYVDGPCPRIGTLSKRPCDFSVQPSFGANGGPSTGLTFNFIVGPVEAVGYFPTLAFDTTYYINVKNVNGAASNNIYIDTLIPVGM